jgi:hypothetical protein
MDQNKNTLERAFELARSGTVSTVAQIRDALKAEGYTHQQVEGSALGKQLRGLIQQAQGSVDRT